uniref:Uncharacterized protein n=1 Tax=Panagrolaimus sp. ES5 TaxID=591445 RepID=A0AC34F7H3_9BILA
MKFIITFCSLICLVQSKGKEVVDGSYMRFDKVKHLAELHPISERKFEYKFLDMVFDIIVDLPLHINGLTPYLFCPEIIFTLFLNDIDKNMYQCDAPGISSKTITLACQKLEGITHVNCSERHRGITPSFLKLNNSIIFQADSGGNNALKIIMIGLIIVILALVSLLSWLIYPLQKRIINFFNNNGNPPPLRQNGNRNIEHGPLNDTTQNGVGGIEEPNPENVESHEAVTTVSSQLLENSKKFKQKTSEKIKKADFEQIYAWQPIQKNQISDGFEEITLPSEASDFEKIFDKDDSSSSMEPFENLTDDEEWISDTKTKNKNLIQRMRSNHTPATHLPAYEIYAKSTHIITMNKNDVTSFDTKNKKLCKFPAAVDYNFYPPKVGVDYLSATVITPNIFEYNPKASLLSVKPCYTSNRTYQCYVIEIDKKERLIQAESILIDLIRKASKFTNSKDTVAFITPAYFSEKQKNAYLHASHNCGFWNLEFVDEQLALGYCCTKVGKKYFIVINCYDSKVFVSLFRYENEKNRKCVEIDDIERSGKDVYQFTEAITFLMKEKFHDKMHIFVTRNNSIFTALEKHYLKNDIFTLKFIEHPEEMLVKGDAPVFLPLRFENINFNSELKMKHSLSLPKKSNTFAENVSRFKSHSEMFN